MARHLSHPETWALAGGLALICAFSIGLAFFISWSAALVLFILCAAFVCVVTRPVWGLYALAFAAPMSGLIIDFSRDQTLSRVPYIGAINAPLVDFIALFLLLAITCIAAVRPHTYEIQWRALTTHAWFFVAWFAAVGASVYFGDKLYWGTAVKAFARPYVFTFVAFVAPVLLLARTRMTCVRALIAYESAAVIGAVMGLASIFFVTSIGFILAVPFSVFGYAPFGTNHNVLAESLTAIIPFAWWIAMHAEKKTWKNFGYACAGLITLVSLLTFSRAAWIVVAIQIGAWAVWHKKIFFERIRGVKIIVCAVIVLAIFFLGIQSTKFAESSDATRITLSEISYTYFLRAPMFGQGPGTFVPIVDETVAFHMDYGDALDAHGVVQKIVAETGAVGTLAFAVLVIALGVRLWRRRHDEFYFILFLMFVSLWTYQLFNTGYFLGKVWVPIGVTLAALSV